MWSEKIDLRACALLNLKKNCSQHAAKYLINGKVFLPGWFNEPGVLYIPKEYEHLAGLLLMKVINHFI